MVSLRRRKLMGLYSGRSSFLTPLARVFDNGHTPGSSSQTAKSKNIAKVDSTSPNVSGSVSSKEHQNQPLPGQPIKHRKRHRRKLLQNQQPCPMRGVYFKNMKWQAAIKVDKKQIHLGTVGSQEEAARLYDRAAFMCGREPNFELSEEEKQELRKFKWDEFLAYTRRSITNKKRKQRLEVEARKRSESSIEKGEWDTKQGVNNSFSASEEMESDSSAS
ncbi:hypothetical protein V6N12_022891 [Hibiscus sabdariffa]|uniref:AP2/ERF domain-containing protein n=1 Tax=Hibiscus sabdariffa TaxID=183260 RepID=A0ABR2FWV7_9ROSI